MPMIFRLSKHAKSVGFRWLIVLSALAFFGFTAVQIYAAVTTTAATGGTNISADKAGNATLSGWTRLGDITIVENANGDFSIVNSGTIILTPPSNRAFRAGTGTVTFNTASRNISAASLNALTTGLIITLTVGGTNKADTLSLSGIQVQAILGTGNIGLTGNIVRPCNNSGSAVISGIICNSTNFGTLGQIPGSGKYLDLVLPGQSFVMYSGHNGTCTPQNRFSLFTVTGYALDQFRNVVTRYTGSRSIVFSGPGGTYPSSLIYLNGVATGSLNITGLEYGWSDIPLFATGSGITSYLMNSLILTGQAPKARIVSPLSGSHLSGYQIFTRTGRDNNIVSGYHLSFYTTGGSFITGAWFQTSATGMSYSGNILSDGRYLRDVQAFDTLALSGRSERRLFSVDATPPTFSGVTSGTTYNTGVVITFSDNNSGYSATLNSAPYTSDTSITGASAYVFLVTDAVGNSTGATFTISYVGATLISGNLTVSADKAANSTSGSAYATLANIITSEGSNPNFSPGTGVTFILTAPANRRFRPGSGSVTYLGGGTRNIKSGSLAVTESTITATFDIVGTDLADSFSITDIQVQAITGNIVPSTGYLLRTCANPGTMGVYGIVCDSSLYYTFSQSNGAAIHMVTTLPGQTFINGYGNSGSALTQTAGVSFNLVGLTAVDQYKHIITSYNGSKTISYSGAVGTFTTGVSFTNGQSTTTLATILPAHGIGIMLTATDGTLVGLPSALFDNIDTLPPSLTAVHISSDNSYSGSFAKIGDKITITFTGNEILTGVTAIIASGSATVTNISGNLRKAEYTVNSGTIDGSAAFLIGYADLAGTTGSVSSSTDGSSVTIHNHAPSATVIYSPGSGTWTSGNVTATLTGYNEPIVVTNTSGGSLSYIFTTNTGFVFLFRDDAGNTGSTSSSVDWIDKTFPSFAGVVSGNDYHTGVRIIFSDNNTGYSATLDGTGYTSGTLIDGTGSHVFVVTDVAGNTAGATFSIAYLDVSIPTANVVYNITGWTNTDVRATVTGFSEEVTGLNATGYTFTDNGTFVFQFFDLAGNTGYATGTVNRIDKIIPTFAGIASGGSYTGTATITYADAHLSGAIISGLDTSYYSGAYTSGTPLTATGTYLFMVYDLAGNSTGAIFTILPSADITPPVLDNIHITSNNANSGYAAIGNLITLIFTGNESLTGIFVTIDGNIGFVTGAGMFRIGTYTMTSSGTESTIPFTIDYHDLAYNTGIQRTGTTDASYVVFDKTSPVFNGVTTGSWYATGVRIMFSDESSGYTATLNGAPYTSGTLISAADTYSFVVTDPAGNSTGATFHIDYSVISITPADGEHAIISADLASDSISGGSYTTLTNIVFNESAPTNFGEGTGTIILTAPNNRKFRSGSGVISCQLGSRNIKTCSIAVTESTIVVTIFVSGTNLNDSLGIADIQVQAISGSRIGTIGTILRTCANPGTANVFGLVCDSTNFGQFRLIAGTARHIVTTLPGQVFVEGLGNSGSAFVQTAGVSFVLPSLTAIDQYFNINPTYSGNKTISYAGAAGLFTTGVTFMGGQSVTTLTTTILSGGTGVTITASDSTISGMASSPFYVMNVGVPTGHVIYDITGRTNTDVRATVTGFNEVIVRQNATGYTFTGNGSFLFAFANIENQTGYATGTVTWVDKVMPAFAGVVSGVTYTGAVSIIFSDNNTGYSATLNGTGYISGTQITTDGIYVFAVTDIAGNSTGATFIIDMVNHTIPTLTAVHMTSSNAHSGYAKMGDTLTVSFTGSEDLSGIFVVIAGGAENVTGGGSFRYVAYVFQTGDSQGPVDFSIHFHDLAGNTGLDVTGTTDGSQVIYDETMPTFAGVVSGTTYTGSVSIMFSDNSTGYTATLNGTGYASGTTINASGYYVFVVTDLAGNTTGATFTITLTTPDTTPPTASVIYDITGRTNTNVHATITGFSEAVTGLNATGHTFTGNGTFVFEFFDLAGNTGYATGAVTWIDKVMPTFAGVTSGTTYTGAVSIMFSDNNTGYTATLNGTGYASGTTINASGYYVFVVTDLAGNTTGATFTITLTTPDTTPPTANVIYDITGRTNANVRATITGFSEAITGLNATGHTFTGNGTFVFEFFDLAGNTGHATGTVTWIDKENPVVTLVGSSNMSVLLSGSYVEQGANRTDNRDGSGFIPSPSSGTVDVYALGTYLLFYTYTDAVGNSGSVQRTVTVTGSAIPLINISGANPYIIEYGTPYIEYGATWSDSTDGNGDVIDVLSTVDTGTLGTGYTVTYIYINSLGYTGTAIRNVTVKDTIPPVITLNGSGTVSVEYGSSYTELGATYTDAHLGFGSVTTISGSVNTLITGTYVLTYLQADASGNTGSANRTVIVLDPAPPLVSDVSALVLSGTSAQISFTTNISALGYVRYGIGALTSLQVGTTGTSHNIRLDGLTDNATYTYRVFGRTSYYTGELSATGTFTTPLIALTGNLIVTGEIQTASGTYSGELTLMDGQNTLILSGFTNSSLQRLFAPSMQTGVAQFGESGIPSSSETSGDTIITRVILQTFHAGGSGGVSMISEYFRISFVVPTGTSGQYLQIYRSNEGNSWAANVPDSACILDSSLICSFRTDHLSYFAVVGSSSAAATKVGGQPNLTKDDCPDGDLSPSYYDGACEFIYTTWHGEVEGLPITGDITDSRYSSEMNNAYLFAYENGITTQPTIFQANMDGYLLRSNMAKMMTNFTTKVLGKTPDISLACDFNDIQDQSDEMRFYITTACQLRLMGIQSDGAQAVSFNPNGIVTRAEFGTVLSRMLFDGVYDGGIPYYAAHLNALKEIGIMTKISSPLRKELRGYVMLMLMRSVLK